MLTQFEGLLAKEVNAVTAAVATISSFILMALAYYITPLDIVKSFMKKERQSMKPQRAPRNAWVKTQTF